MSSASTQQFEALYVHVPFCARKCDYCAFYSRADSAPAVRQAYLERIGREFAEFADRAFAPLDSVFFGGGTPTFLEPRELEALLRAVRRSFRIRPDAEISMECNPESLTEAKAAVMAAWGINRVSLGVQSFSPALRETLGRHGNPELVAPALRMLRRHGIENLGIDLIYAIPGQTLKDWENDLRRALELRPKHLSTYSLTVEEGTALEGRQKTEGRRQKLEDGRQNAQHETDELSAEMWAAAETVAESAGLKRYEISNFALPGFECRHNLATWHGGAYLGCGPAACSFDGALRWGNPSSLDEWMKPEIRRELDRLPPEARATEVLIFGLRTIAGWSRGQFQARTGFDFLELRSPQIRQLAADGLLELQDDRLCPTRLGLLFNDVIGRELL